MMKHLKQIAARLDEYGIDAMLVSSEPGERYAVGFKGEGYVVVAKNECRYFTDSRYIEAAEKQVTGISVTMTDRAKNYRILIQKAIDDLGIEKLGFEDGYMTVAQYRQLADAFTCELVPAQGLLGALRTAKDEEEIALIRTAEHIGDAAFRQVLELVRPGVTERELAFELELAMRRAGASGLSFETIVASGVRSAMPHGVASNKKIERGDLVVFDFGCVYEGYCSDMTRTIGVGTLSDAQKDLYALVLKAQQSALAAARAGVVGEKMQDLVQAVFDKAGFGSYFGHGLGHSVGLEIHEEPRFSRNVKDSLPAGTVISVEPGLYVPGIGGVRIEDLVVLREGGCENLTTSPKELLIV